MLDGPTTSTRTTVRRAAAADDADDADDACGPPRQSWLSLR
jgi:hypothetical protein